MAGFYIQGTVFKLLFRVRVGLGLELRMPLFAFLPLKLHVSQTQ